MKYLSNILLTTALKMAETRPSHIQYMDPKV